jgi:hypothetical protein
MQGPFSACLAPGNRTWPGCPPSRAEARERRRPRLPAALRHQLAALALLGALGGCSSSEDLPAQNGALPPAAAQTSTPDTPRIAWRPVGSWSGRGSLQTGSFPSDTGYFRFVWKTSAPTGETPDAAAPAFRLALHSAISGRPLATVAEASGPAAETSYVAEDPRVFYVVVEAAGLDWTFTVEEGSPAEVSRSGTH